MHGEKRYPQVTTYVSTQSHQQLHLGAAHDTLLFTNIMTQKCLVWLGLVFLLRPKCDPIVLPAHCRNVLHGGHIFQCLAVFEP
jgi:hypothetical protein